MVRKKIKAILKEVGLEEYDRRLQEKDGEIARLHPFESLVHDSRPEKLRRVFEDNRALWSTTVPTPATTIYIDDPIYRQVLIEPEIAPVFRHPIVQRLAHIKQLSFSYLTFPAATHSRLSHSLGAARNAERAITRILEKGELYTTGGVKPVTLSSNDQRRLIMKAKIAALLHDLGHGPFGHGLDQYVMAKKDEPSPDKFYAVNYITQYLADTVTSSGIDADEILAILDNKRRSELEGYDTLISNLIDAPLDVDRMDYLVRDAHMTGLSVGAVNIDALIERMVPFQGPIKVGDEEREQVILAFRPSALSYITHLLYARDSMYLNCYEHPGKVVAERMLTKAVSEFSIRNPTVTTDDLMLLTDEDLLKLLIQFSDPGDLPYNYAQALLKNVPFNEVFEICPRKYGAYMEKKAAQQKEGKTMSELEEVPLKPAKRIENWEADSLQYEDRNLTTPTQWENKIAADADLGSDSWKVIVTVPSPGSVEPKFDDIKVLTETGTGYDYTKLDRKTGFWEGVLKHLAVERYSIKVFASADLDSAKLKKINEAAAELLTEH